MMGLFKKIRGRKSTEIKDSFIINDLEGALENANAALQAEILGNEGEANQRWDAVESYLALAEHNIAIHRYE